jgi:phage terminase large subunit GpA-like protein
VIDERDKDAMLREAVWIPTYPERSARHKSYHFNALYSPLGLGYSWRELVQQWLGAQGKPEKLQVFVNERLGLPWEDRRTQIDPDDLASRAEPYRMRVLQPGGLLLTAGVDTQDDRLVVQIIAWGQERDWWVMDWLELPGEPTSPALWEALTALLARPIATPSGHAVPIEATAIDMGGHFTEEVKAYVRACPLPRVMAILGSRHRLDTPLSRPRKTDYSPRGSALRWGMRYYQVGTELCKDRVFGDLRADAGKPPADRRGHFTQDLPPEYYAGLLSETWNPKRNRYEPRRGMTRRNEPLDTWVYAYAAAHHPEVRLDRMRPIDWARRAERIWQLPIPPAETAPTPTTTHPTPETPTGAPAATPAEDDLFSPIAMR